MGARLRASLREAGHLRWLLTVAVWIAHGCMPTRPPPDPRLPLDLGPDDEWIYATHPQLPLEAARVRALSEAAVNATSDFMARPVSAGDDPRAGGRLLVRIEDVTEGESFEVSVLVGLTLPSGTSWQGRGTGVGAAEAAVRDAIDEGLDEAMWESRSAHLSDEDLLAVLRSSSPRRSWIAVGRLASRRHPAVFAPLVDAVRGDCRTEQASSALSGLAALGDARAASPVVDAMERCDDPTFQLQAAFALGSLGGDEAEAYLFTLSAGHADPRMREAAREAHALLLRQAPRDGGAGDVP